MRYTVLVTREDDVIVVRVASLPGCFTQGSSVDEALDRASEAIAGHVAALRDLGQPIPIELSPPIVASVETEPAA